MLLTIPDLIKKASASVRRISSIQAYIEIKGNKGLLIDVREPSEFASKSIEGAVNIPRGLLEMLIIKLESDPKRPIYLHCATSARATLAAEQLKRIGYEKVSAITCSLDAIEEARKVHGAKS